MNDWQPIETAPWDGTDILVSDGRQVWIDWWHSPGVWGIEMGNPTHWMPLPEPPEI